MLGGVPELETGYSRSSFFLLKTKSRSRIRPVMWAA